VDKEWPPKTQLGVVLYTQAITQVLHEWEQTDGECLVKEFQKAFTNVSRQEPELYDQMMVWYTTVYSEVRVQALMHSMRSCLADGAAEMQDQLTDMCSEAQQDVVKQVHDELPVAIEHILRAETSQGKITKASELHATIKQIQEQFRGLLPVVENEDEIVASAELWLCVDDSISFDDFSSWFLDVFGKKVQNDVIMLPEEESVTRVQEMLDSRRTVAENKAANADMMSVRDTARFKARMKIKQRQRGGSTGDSAGYNPDLEGPPPPPPPSVTVAAASQVEAGTAVPVAMPVEVEVAQPNSTSPTSSGPSRTRLRAAGRARKQKARGTVQI